MYDSLHVNGEQNLDSLADDKVHRERRAIWDRSLSMSCKSTTPTVLGFFLLLLDLTCPLQQHSSVTSLPPAA